jgi:hypothetical protein
MKKIFMCILLWNIYFIGLTDIYGQEALNKGVYSLAGTINYSSSSYKDNYSQMNSHTFTFAPQFVYFVGNHTALGVEVNYTNYFSGQTTSSFSIGPSFRYYFYVEDVIPFLQANINIADPNLESSSGVSFGFGITGGLNFFLSNSVALEPSVSYTYSSFSVSGSNTSTTTNAFKIGIGVNYYIFREK